MDGEIIENDTKTIVWTENILSVFGAKTPFSNVSGLVWTGPKSSLACEFCYRIGHSLTTSNLSVHHGSYSIEYNYFNNK